MNLPISVVPVYNAPMPSLNKNSAGKTTAEFDRLYNVLNAAQKKAVDTVEGPVVVIAGPGTGKTTVLTLRIANILRKTDTAPENILALTFTESGAHVMRRKLVEIIGPAAYKVNIQTFHGFAEKIIQEYPDYFARIIGSKIITDAEQVKIIEKLIQSREIKILRPFGDPSYYVKSVLNEIHLLKRESVSPAGLLKSIKEDKKNGKLATTIDSKGREKELSATEIEKLEKRNEKNLELAAIYSHYEEELAEQKFYDFDDMLLELIRAMESDKMFKLMLQESYQYILADEHQDANASQNRILELLADFHDSPNLFIVGDDKQAIYRFQGASLENFLYFSKKYRDAVVIELTHNYRSHQGILDASHSLIENNPAIPGYVRPKLISLQVGSKPIFVDEFASKKDELYSLATLIDKLIKKGEKPEEIAVLYRENKEAKDIAEALRSRGILCRIESDNNILDDVDSAKVIILCRAIHDLSNSADLGKALLLSELGCDPASVSEVFNQANRERVSLHQLIEELIAGTKWPQLRDAIGFDRLKEIKAAYHKMIKWSGEAQTLTFPDFLQKLIQETNLLAGIVAAPNSLERLSSLETLFDRAVKAAQSKETFRLTDFIEYIDIVSGHGIMAKRSRSDHEGGVRLMTAHRSKGLEFNHVFLVNIIDGIWGNRIRRNHFSVPVIEHARDIGRIEDERRLFYVAMTRARESVSISYSRLNEDKEAVPSQFISEIDTELISFTKLAAISENDLFSAKMKTPHATPSISILDVAFVRSKFLAQPFSVTHLNSYLHCPWQYFFVNLIRVPQAPNKHQMYGTAIHLALRIFFEAYKTERDMPKKELIEIFKHYLDRQAMSLDDRTDSFAKGKEALEGYFDAYKGHWNRNLLNEYAVKAVELTICDEDDKSKACAPVRAKKTKTTKLTDITAGAISKENKPILYLTGKLDKVEFIDEKNVAVIDYKTAKPKSRNDIEGKTKTSDGNYKRQLVFYKLLLDGDNKFNMRYGEIDFIEPNERGIYKKERFDITDAEVEELKSIIKKTAKEIISLSFIDSVCEDKECEYCRLGKILRG
jgi:DNA helicase-2/ATP-dependent DNA helicase PcrA